MPTNLGNLAIRNQVTTHSMDIDRPGALQHVFEVVVGFIDGQSHEIIGSHSEAHTPFLATLALFILFCNLIGGYRPAEIVALDLIAAIAPQVCELGFGFHTFGDHVQLRGPRVIADPVDDRHLRAGHRARVF